MRLEPRDGLTLADYVGGDVNLCVTGVVATKHIVTTVTVTDCKLSGVYPAHYIYPGHFILVWNLNVSTNISMCWSAEGSLKTYALAMTLALIHKYANTLNPTMLLFMVVFTQMQLVEYFLWKNLSVPSYNKLWSSVGVALLIIQPLVSAMLLHRDLRNKAWMITIVGTFIYFLISKVDLSTEVGANGHLKWNWIPSLSSPWALAWLVMLCAPLWVTGHRLAALFGILTYFISAYFNDAYGTAGSYWCWIAVSVFFLAFLKTD